MHPDALKHHHRMLEAAKARRTSNRAAPVSGGPGTELKKLLKRIGITAKPNCSCNARARQMDAAGVAWCRANVAMIVDWLAEEAARRKLPFSRLAASTLVRLAIRRAEKRR